MVDSSHINSNNDAVENDKVVPADKISADDVAPSDSVTTQVDTRAYQSSIAYQPLMNQGMMPFRTVHLSSGEMIHDADAPASDIFFVVSGQIRTYWRSDSGSEQLMEVHGKNSWFGATALAQEATYGTIARVVENAQLRVVKASDFLTALQAHPQLCINLAQQLAQRLHRGRQLTASLVFDPCDQRLVRAMIRFGKSAAATTQGEQVTLRMTHEQLAQSIGVARETVSLSLIQMRQRNLVRTGRNQIVFNPTMLSKAFLNRQVIDAIAGKDLSKQHYSAESA